VGKEVESEQAAPGLPHAKGSNIWMSRGSFVSQNSRLHRRTGRGTVVAKHMKFESGSCRCAHWIGRWAGLSGAGDGLPPLHAKKT